MTSALEGTTTARDETVTVTTELKPEVKPKKLETGSVKFFNRDKGWGFIAKDSGESVFVHYSGVAALDAEGHRNLYEGQRVSFEAKAAERRPKAVNVRVLELQQKASC